MAAPRSEEAVVPIPKQLIRINHAELEAIRLRAQRDAQAKQTPWSMDEHSGRYAIVGSAAVGGSITNPSSSSASAPSRGPLVKRATKLVLDVDGEDAEPGFGAPGPSGPTNTHVGDRMCGTATALVEQELALGLEDSGNEDEDDLEALLARFQNSIPAPAPAPATMTVAVEDQRDAPDAVDRDAYTLAALSSGELDVLTLVDQTEQVRYRSDSVGSEPQILALSRANTIRLAESALRGGDTRQARQLLRRLQTTDFNEVLEL